MKTILKYDLNNDRWHSRLFTRNIALAEPQLLLQMLDSTLGQRDRKIIGILSGWRFKPIASLELPRFLKTKRDSGWTYVIQTDPWVVVYVGLLPPCLPHATESYRYDFTISFSAYEGFGFEAMKELLSDCFSAFGSYWGEISDLRMTDRPTQCGLDGHYSVVPKLATANLWSDAYVEFLGGVSAFETAGFEKNSTFKRRTVD